MAIFDWQGVTWGACVTACIMDWGLQRSCFGLNWVVFFLWLWGGGSCGFGVALLCSVFKQSFASDCCSQVGVGQIGKPSKTSPMGWSAFSEGSVKKNTRGLSKKKHVALGGQLSLASRWPALTSGPLSPLHGSWAGFVESPQSSLEKAATNSKTSRHQSKPTIQACWTRVVGYRGRVGILSSRGPWKRH